LVDGAIDFISEAGGKLLIIQGRVKLKAEAALRPGKSNDLLGRVFAINWFVRGMCAAVKIVDNIVDKPRFCVSLASANITPYPQYRISENSVKPNRCLENREAGGAHMNSYISLMLDAKGAEGRIYNAFESDPENDVGRPSLVVGEASIWVVSLALVILGFAKAAYSSESMVWLTVWPTPLVLISTLTAFLRQGCHYRNGVLVLGRYRR
jgi:hypothetical protein